MSSAPRPRWRRRLLLLAGALFLPPALHLGVEVGTRIEPPPLAQAGEIFGEVVEKDGVRRLGPAYARRRGKILEVSLAGSPEAIGRQHALLLRGEMVENESVLYGEFEKHVPFSPARLLLVDLARLRFREVDRGFPEARLREIAAQAEGFRPDPFEGFLPTYHRFVFLQALYDIGLSFEHSPMLGCTSFALTNGAFEQGGAALARNFDFEAGEVFDRGKAVFLVREEGRIPYASVAWPGLVGAVTGMNERGLALVVHGARAREPVAAGEPLVHTMRDVLGLAGTTAEALALLGERRPMVSHMVMLVDASGDAAVAERVPGEPTFVRRGRGKLPLTNHLEGPLAADPKNREVEARTSTWPRRRRLDELLENLPEGASVERVVGVLRDKAGEGGRSLPLGDRRALDALIATHGVVLDATRRVLWVSEGPHLAGRFLRFDLARLLGAEAPDASGPGPALVAPEDVIPADPILGDGSYEAWVSSGRPHAFDEKGEKR